MEITTIKKNDILFGKIDVGNMSLSRAQEYLNNIKTEFKKHFSNDLILTASRNLNNGADFEILRRE